MTIETRLSRLEDIVEKLATHTTTFIKSSTEFNATVTGSLQTLSATVTAALETHGEEIHRHSEEIRRLDAMITRFDAWLRGRGPQDGHERRGT